MIDELLAGFSSSGFAPHGSCIAWSPNLLYWLVAANAAISVAYIVLSLSVLYIARHRVDLRIGRVLAMFSAFIFSCGLTHATDIVIMWLPIYWLDAWLRGVTAALSVLTAITLWRLFPRIISLPSHTQLAEANLKLSDQIADCHEKEDALLRSEERYRELSENLEQKVAFRTAELAETNQRLQKEIEDRQRMQYELQVVNRKLEHTLRQQASRSNEMEQLNKMSDLMQSCVSMHELVQVLSNFAAGYLEVPSGAVYLIDEHEEIAVAEASWGKFPEVERVIPISSCWALRLGQIHPSDSLQHGLHCQHVSENIEHYCVPLIGNGETLGILYLRQPQEIRELAFLEGIAKRAALAMVSLRAREVLFNKAIHDPLTGLYNRRHLEEEVREAERRARRTNRSIGVMMLDLDHFKAVNDTHGHEVGDLVLREFADKLRASLRGGDVACRYGGEEFTVLLSGATLAATKQRAEQFRHLVEDMCVHSHGTDLHLTVSIGIAAFPESADRLTTVLQLADKSLYQAKHGGRNCVYGAIGHATVHDAVGAK